MAKRAESRSFQITILRDDETPLEGLAIKTEYSEEIGDNALGVVPLSLEWDDVVLLASALRAVVQMGRDPYQSTLDSSRARNN